MIRWHGELSFTDEIITKLPSDPRGKEEADIFMEATSARQEPPSMTPWDEKVQVGKQRARYDLDCSRS
jgi:hypothetical protein